MKKIIAFLITFTMITGSCFAADLVEGFWLSIDEKTGKVTAGWEIFQQGGKLFGKLLSSSMIKPDVLAFRCKDRYDGFPISGKVSVMPVAGTPWIFNLTMSKPGEWAGGNIINPEDGKMYKCKIIFHPADGRKYETDTLEMRGEIGFGIGRSQFWKSSDFETASGLWPR